MTKVYGQHQMGISYGRLLAENAKGTKLTYKYWEYPQLDSKLWTHSNIQAQHCDMSKCIINKNPLTII